jgi:hypothetical protein
MEKVKHLGQLQGLSVKVWGRRGKGNQSLLTHEEKAAADGLIV